jgi:hypothetical protein
MERRDIQISVPITPCEQGCAHAQRFHVIATDEGATRDDKPGMAIWSSGP